MNLAKKIKLLPGDIQLIIKKAGNLADKMGVSAYVVGGFVRDILLSKPNFDVDIVVEGDGIGFARALASILKAELIKHVRFATASLTLGSKLKVDIASARSETYAKPAVLPTVKPGTIGDDLARRDFTINAMAAAINKDDFGKLIDYFSSRADLATRKIRVLHDLSFIDDPTRMLRAVRFEQRYGFNMDRKTLNLFNRANGKKMLKYVTKHRIRDELILMLKEDRAVKMIKRVDKLYGLSFIHGRLRLSSANLKFLNELDKMIECFRVAYPKKRGLDSWLIFFTALLDGVKPADIKKICFEFAFKKCDTRRITLYHQEHRKVLKRIDKKGIRPSVIYQNLEPLSFEAIVLIMAKEKKTSIRKKINEFLLSHNGIKLVITGEDLRGLGFIPGPHFKKMLLKALHAKVDRVIKNKEDEIRFVKKHGSRHIRPIL